MLCRALRLVGLTGVALVASVGGATLLAEQPPGLSPRLVLVQQLAWANYPELRTANLQSAIRETPDGVTLEFARVPAAAADGELPLRRPPELVIEATFDATNRLTQLTARGQHVHDAERQNLGRAVSSDSLHGNAATLTTDVVAADGDEAGRATHLLRAARASVLPDDPEAFTRLRVSALAATLGPMTVTAVAFETHEPRARLCWRVSVTAADGAAYDVAYEPFDGRLLSVTRTGGVQ